MSPLTSFLFGILFAAFLPLAASLEENPISALRKTRASLDQIKAKVHPAFWSDIGIELNTTYELAHVRRRSQKGESVLLNINAHVDEDLYQWISNFGNVIFSSTRYNSMTAEIPSSMVEYVALHNSVFQVKPAEKFIAWKQDVSEGVKSHRADLLGTLNITGKGVKIGVISDSVDYLSLVQSSGDLPNVTVLPGQQGAGTSEGSAMLEILNDLAPEAELFFATAGYSQASFAENILALAAAGCRVIVDDILFLPEPVYEDGIIAQAIDEVKRAGVAFFSAAGNSGSTTYQSAKTYEAMYVGGPITSSAMAGIYPDTHTFKSSKLAAQPFVTVTGSSYSQIIITLHWADRMDAPQTDLDLVVLDNTGSSVVAFSADEHQAFEMVSFFGTGTSSYRVYVPRYSGPPKLFSLRVYSANLDITTTGSIYGHTAAEGAFSIAATPRFISDSFFSHYISGEYLHVESFSSQGPRRIFFLGGQEITPGVYSSAGGLIRNKPDFTAADGVSTSTPGFTAFFGTSAAAPHAAGLAALLLSFRPHLSVDQLRDIMTLSSLDTISPGWDDISGNGILDALRMIEISVKYECDPSLCKNGGGCTAYQAACNCAGTNFTGPLCDIPLPPPTPTCPSGPFMNATWPSIPALSSANGTCLQGFTGLPRRACLAKGLWATNVTSPCVRNCPGELYARATWPETAAGAKSVGLCIPGWKGAPVRICKADGSWQDLVNFHCVRV